MTHQEQIDLMRQGKQRMTGKSVPTARPGSRDADTADREPHPRMR